MKNTISIRAMKYEDLKNVALIIDDNGLFPSDYLGDMTTKYFDGSSEERWFVAELEDNQVIGVAYVAPEIMTDKTWNLLLIAIFKSYQNLKLGQSIIKAVEEELEAYKARILLIETSGLENYAAARKCYLNSNYQHIATLPDYYEDGDDKLVFMKKLSI
ncbi:GNAT family N-acetyltransferase [Thorsellia anophelis]|uniref:Ribosomal protein S18 acetylase RimI n=1 Tax=Thorsellia anophelis DSM 18579 TaxID=1123402 RepID=A0A1I0BH34_9GAMM|nr:GNAT family N-acetyltransferase [Thorsellia anophelis]SET06224.1 Ribosomal protein S18 acetylase RimI [Thorsellia anophelis DSM 18579]